MTKAATWHFRAMQKGEINVDPVHDEFFKAQDLVDALVRESIQNSLDARRGRSNVRVRFRFASGPDALANERASRYITGIEDHLQAVASELPYAPPSLSSDMSFLSIEDYGTRGLGGDPETESEAGDDEPGYKNDFYYFWRNVGRSMKGENSRGRWGLGKAVFSVSSMIRSVIGVTKRPDESESLLLGQCVLKVHSLNDRRRYPYGFFGRFQGDLALPISDEGFIKAFSDDFGLDRAEPGLSLVIPWYRSDDLRYDQLIESVIRQYFYPITRGDLVVEIREGGRSEVVNRETIAAVASRHSRSEYAAELARLTELTRWSISVNDDERVSLPDPGLDAPEWIAPTRDPQVLTPKKRALLSDVEQKLLSVREHFHSGGRVAIRVPVPIKKRARRLTESHFDLYLEKDDSLKRGEHHYIRRGITISDVNRGNRRDRPIRALLVVDDEPLSTLLGDAENPAHSEWSERADKIRQNYHHGAFTVRYVKNSLAYLAGILLRPPEVADRDLLKDIFSTQVASSSSSIGERPQPHQSGEGQSAVGMTALQPTHARARIVPLKDGFSIQGGAAVVPEGTSLKAEAAYRSRTGNPFRSYSPLDFRFGELPIRIDQDNVAITTLGDNYVAFSPGSSSFQLRVRGFDPRRDLIVRLTTIDIDAP